MWYLILYIYDSLQSADRLEVIFIPAHTLIMLKLFNFISNKSSDGTIFLRRGICNNAQLLHISIWNDFVTIKYILGICFSCLVASIYNNGKICYQNRGHHLCYENRGETTGKHPSGKCFTSSRNFGSSNELWYTSLSIVILD